MLFQQSSLKGPSVPDVLRFQVQVSVLQMKELLYHFLEDNGHRKYLYNLMADTPHPFPPTLY